MPAPLPAVLPFGIQVLHELRPRTVLDIGLGFGRWGMLAHEICDDWQGRIHRENWRTRVEAVAPFPHAVEEYHHFFYDWIHIGEPNEVLGHLEPVWDLVVLGHECFGDPDASERLLTRALELGRYVLVMLPMASESRNGDSRGWWSAGDLLVRHPVRHGIEAGGDVGAFLFSRDDPRALRRRPTAVPVFERIFQDNLWCESESRSGPGSSLVQTVTVRREMPTLMRRLGARSLLDVPCGDWNWMRHVDLDVTSYLGGDIVPELVASNQARFGDPEHRFVVLDMTRDPIPRVDVVLCRDALVHLSFDDALRALANFCRSGSTFLLTTTFTDHCANAPAETGEWRPLNLQAPPFSFPAPLEMINEGCTEGNGLFADKSLGLWRLVDLMNNAG